MNEPNVPPPPRQGSTVVLGGGTAGAVVAARLVEAGRHVLLVEAGPDYGPKGSGHWPADLLDAGSLPRSHDWGYTSAGSVPSAGLGFGRAKVIGGCSAHNGCAQLVGHQADYEGWVASGCVGWEPAGLRAHFAAALGDQGAREYEDDELTPFQALFREAAIAAGIPPRAHLNELDQALGVGSESLNIVDGVRQNTAFTYLDPHRGDPRLEILADCLVDRLRIDAGRVTGVVVHGAGREMIPCDEVVLCAGTYGTPAILQRSGVGDRAMLAAIGVPMKLDLGGVGANLQDHPVVYMTLGGSPWLEARMGDWARDRWTPDEQLMVKARSAVAPADDPLDLHIFPVGGRPTDGAFRLRVGVACLTPHARGEVRIVDRDPASMLHIDHNFLGDPDGHDTAVLADGVRLVRAMVATEAVHGRLGLDLDPGVAADLDGGLEAWVEAHVEHYWHPVGSCRMGPAGDPAAVVDPEGRIHGLDNARIADCSVMPVIPRATTALPAVVVAEKVAAAMVGA